MPPRASFGSWRSPISATAIASDEVPLSMPDLVDGDVYWLEGKPLEGGRVCIVRLSADGTRQELTAAPFNVRTRVHEYGGGAYLVRNQTVYFSNFADQRLYRQAPGKQPEPISPEPTIPAGTRYADGQITPDGRWLICVRERHTSAETPDAWNELAVIAPDGSAEARVIAEGHDFFSSPRISPDGRQLAWLSWDHPNMPWDGTELWLADLNDDGSLGNACSVAGGPEESIYQPEWSPSGQLHFVSDRTNWWNLYRLEANGKIKALAQRKAEFGSAQWVFGMRSYAFLGDETIASIVSVDGFDRLGLLRPRQKFEFLDLPYTAYGRNIRASGNQVVFTAASPTEPNAVIRLDASTGECQVLGRSLQVGNVPLPAYVSVPRSIKFPTEDGKATAYAIYYPPTNAEFTGAEGEKPPLIVQSHGGPTGKTTPQLELEIQFWTSRGFGLVDVNYGGSTGYGREYRNRLRGLWGIVDTEDCINAARYLAEKGEVDGKRLVIRGGSAGGYTTLCALVFHDDFAAGASYYGVADCEALAQDTHKFESRYLDGLIGPYPAEREVYYARSPIHFTDRLSCPVILFQGLEDRVVPPAQAEQMAAALRAKGLPVAYLAFEGEQHGFRQASTIKRTLEAELYFYSKVFGFSLPEEIEPVEIENLRM